MLLTTIPDLAPEYVSVCFLLVILFVALLMNKTKTNQLRLILTCIIVAILCMICEIISYVVFDYLDQRWAINVGYISNSLYYLLMICVIFLGLIYILTYVINDENELKKYVKLLIVPIGLLIICLIANLFEPHIWFSYRNDGYNRGIGFIIQYVIVSIYVLIMIIVIIVKRKWIDKNILPLLLFFPIGTIFIAFLQLLFAMVFKIQLEFQGTGIALIIVLVFIFLSNRQTNTDDLTGLLTRSLLIKHLQQAINKDKHDYKVIFIDLKEFRLINEKYTSYIGDKALIEVAKFLHHIAYPNATYLYSGDIFAIVLTSDYYKNSVNLINDIIKEFNTPWQIMDYNIMLKPMIGIYDTKLTFDKQIYFSTFVDFFIKYLKEHGNEGVIYCTNKIIKTFEREIQVTKAVIKAIDEKLFDIYIQPVYNLDQESYTCGEVLARLYDDELKNISPTEFVGLAEKKSLVNQIDFIILEKACQSINYLRSEGIYFESLSVNFSSFIFKKLDCVEQIINIISKYGIDPHSICIEITERAIIESIEEASMKMSQLKEAGIRIYLDDFGVGNSNLASVMSLPFDVIKIDKLLIDSAVKSKDSAQFLQSMISIFNDDHFKVICEGVSSRKHLEIVKDTKCRLIQGFYYCQPLSIPKLIHFMKN